MGVRSCELMKSLRKGCTVREGLKEPYVLPTEKQVEGEAAGESARAVGEPDRAWWWMARALGRGRHCRAGCLRFLSSYARFTSWVQGLREFPRPSPHPKGLCPAARRGFDSLPS